MNDAPTWMWNFALSVLAVLFYGWIAVEVVRYLTRREERRETQRGFEVITKPEEKKE